MDLQGKFHVHLTVKNKTDFKLPTWKQTIILLSNDNKEQLDIMFTKHYFIPSNKTKSVEDIKRDVDKYVKELNSRGIEVIRVKLEHESLPTLSPSESNYRECHIKVLENKLTSIPEGFVKSKNPIQEGVYFLNKRWYVGDISDIEHEVDLVVEFLKEAVIEVKLESIVFDSNKRLDKWWA